MKHNLPATLNRTNSTYMCEKLMKFFSVLWLFVLATTIVLAQSGPGSSEYQSGEKLRKNKQYKEAVEAYDRAINAEPNNDKYWFRKGQALANLKEPASMDAAIKSFIKVTELNPSSAPAYNMLSTLSYKQKNIGDAIKYIRLAFEKESDQERKVKYKLVECKYLMSQDKNGEALTALSAAKAIRPNDMKVLGVEGDILVRDNKNDQAIESYSKAYKIAEQAKKRKEMGYYKMKTAIAYKAAGKTSDYDREKSELSKDPGWRTYYNQLIKREKGETATSKNLRLARAYVSINDFDQAKKYINDAITEGKNLVMAYQMLAIVNTKAGETKSAVTNLQKAAGATTDPATIQSINSKMVKLQINNQDYDGALQTANKLVGGGQKDNANLLYYKAIAEYKVQQYTNCISTLESVIANVSKGAKGSEAANAKYYFLMGLAAKKANQNQKAIDAFKKAEFGSFKVAAQSEGQALSGK